MNAARLTGTTPFNANITVLRYHKHTYFMININNAFECNSPSDVSHVTWHTLIELQWIRCVLLLNYFDPPSFISYGNKTTAVLQLH